MNKSDNSAIKLNYNIDPKNKNCDQQNVDNKVKFEIVFYFKKNFEIFTICFYIIFL